MRNVLISILFIFLVLNIKAQNIYNENLYKAVVIDISSGEKDSVSVKWPITLTLGTISGKLSINKNSSVYHLFDIKQLDINTYKFKAKNTMTNSFNEGIIHFVGSKPKLITIYEKDVTFHYYIK